MMLGNNGLNCDFEDRTRDSVGDRGEMIKTITGFLLYGYNPVVVANWPVIANVAVSGQVKTGVRAIKREFETNLSPSRPIRTNLLRDGRFQNAQNL